MEKKPTTLFSVQITERDKQMFKEIAHHRDVSMAGLLRSWIRMAHNKLPKDEK